MHPSDVKLFIINSKYRFCSDRREHDPAKDLQASKWIWVLLTKYKKCSITNASNLEPWSLNISTDAQWTWVERHAKVPKRPITCFKVRIQRGCKVSTGFGNTNSESTKWLTWDTSSTHTSTPLYDSSWPVAVAPECKCIHKYFQLPITS